MKVLVIEDDHRIADSIKKGLEQEHITTDTAYDGAEGFDLASTEEYDVLVMDVMLPEMNGFDICQKLRQKNIATPILMLTAKTQTADKVDGLNYGADDYLSKPFDFAELLARIKALSRRPKNFLSPVLKVGDLQLNTSTYKVNRAGKIIKLPQKEFAILEYLMRHQGQVLSKEKIIENMWSFNEDILPNTVEVYIKNLRNKIEKPFPSKPKLIYTVRGFGYKIEARKRKSK
jgi:two-component system, OmpR family, response regulator